MSPADVAAIYAASPDRQELSKLSEGYSEQYPDVIVLDREQSAILLAGLTNPGEPTQALRELLRPHAEELDP